MVRDRIPEVEVDHGSRKGGYEAGPTLVSDLPPPPTDVGVGVKPNEKGNDEQLEHEDG